MLFINKDININYELYGSGINVVMIHGFSVDHRLMKGCMDNLLPRNKFKSIYIDLPGMGKSNAPKSISSSDDMLKAVIDCIKSIIGEEMFIVIGESYGGYIARGVVKKLYNQIIGIGLICPAIIANKAKRVLPEHQIVIKDEEFLKTLDQSDRENFEANNVILNKLVYRRYQEEIMSGVKISNSEFLKKIESNYEFSTDIDNLEYKIDVPTIVLTGRQDSAVGYEDAFKILKNYNRATFLVLDSAGHNLQIEQPEVFNSLMGNWLHQFTM